MFGIGSKRDVFDALWGKGARGTPAPRAALEAPRPELEAPMPALEAPQFRVVAVNTLPAAPARLGEWHGEKFPGGLGPADILLTDYWTLRLRSAQLYKTNLYGRGLIRRIIDNLINTGLQIEVTPEEAILGYPEDGLGDWTELTENRFRLWAESPRLCDYYEQMAFGELQEFAKREALLCGDILCVLHQDAVTGLPKVQLVSGNKIQSPLGLQTRDAPRIDYGVERDAVGRHVAYWVTQEDGSSKRLAAFGPKTGRRQAWLIYGVDKRLDEVRGEPLLSLVIQSLREIDRYRDSTQRKAVVNSMLAMFIKKGEDKPGTRPITGAAIRRGTEVAADATGAARTFRTMEQIPGLVLDELAYGEEPHGFMPNGTDEKFGDFEAAILSGIAFANGVPPEIYRLFFSNNYSASQAAINEYKLVLNKDRTRFGERFCSPIYIEWLLSEALARRVKAPGLLESWRDPQQYDIFAAWTLNDWSGHIKPSVDALKLVRGHAEMADNGFTTRGRATSEITGQRFSKVVKQLKRENEQLAAALMPLQGLKVKPAEPEPVADDPNDSPDDIDKEDDDAEETPKRSLRIVGNEE